MRRRFGIRGKTMLTMAALTIIPVIVMGMIAMQQSKSIIIEKLNILYSKNMEIVNQQFTNTFDLLISTLQQIPDNQAFQSAVQEPPFAEEEYSRCMYKMRGVMYSSDFLSRLNIPHSYVISFNNNDCYTAFTHSPHISNQEIRKQLEDYAWYQQLESRNYSKIKIGLADNVLNPAGGKNALFCRKHGHEWRK